MEFFATSQQTVSFLQTSTKKRSKASQFLKLFNFKLFPMLTTGCKMAALLSRPRAGLINGSFMTGTLYGYGRGKVSLALQEDPTCVPMFMLELPMLTSTLLKEMGTGLVRIALESETRSHKKRLLDEMVWTVYCNGRKTGYCIKRRHLSDEELTLMQLLRGVSMGAGVLPNHPENELYPLDGELTYMRARFERVIGSKDSEAFHMINPGGSNIGPELSIFFSRT